MLCLGADRLVWALTLACLVIELLSWWAFRDVRADALAFLLVKDMQNVGAFLWHIGTLALAGGRIVFPGSNTCGVLLGFTSVGYTGFNDLLRNIYSQQ